MVDKQAGTSDTRQMLVGAAVAGGGAVLALVVLTATNLGSPTVRAVAAVALGVLAAQLYERTRG
jgi:hypothetical protein